MDRERMNSLLAQGPPPMPGRVAWEPDMLALSSRCPICGEWCDIVYIDRDSLTLGCDRCVTVAYVHDFAINEAEKGGDVQ